MNFTLAYQEIGRFLEYRDVHENENIFIQNCIGLLVEKAERLCIEDRNKKQWYEDATSFLLRLCVIGNIKGLMLHPIDHDQDDKKIIRLSAGIIANQLQSRADGLRFSHLAIPARSVYRLAPSETRLNNEINNDFSRMYNKLSTKKIIQVNTGKLKAGLKTKTNQILAGKR